VTPGDATPLADIHAEHLELVVLVHQLGLDMSWFREQHFMSGGVRRDHFSSEFDDARLAS
jgi:alkanesulfonate monooxygenase SsuD/methylene tetrahydromethanopterin reductase-like flavin-dependent oxidoreductase (luciferase family)